MTPACKPDNILGACTTACVFLLSGEAMFYQTHDWIPLTQALAWILLAFISGMGTVGLVAFVVYRIRRLADMRKRRKL